MIIFCLTVLRPKKKIRSVFSYILKESNSGKFNDVCCKLNPFPGINNTCHLLSHLLMFFGSPYCKQYRLPDEEQSDLIRIQGV